MNQYKLPIIFIIGFILGLLVTCKRDSDTSTSTDTKTSVKTRVIHHIDTVTVTKFAKPEIRFVDRIKLKEGKVIYVDSFDYNNIQRPMLKVNHYNQILDKGKSKAFLSIGTTGELKYVEGIIKSQDSIIERTVEKTVNTTKNASGLFLFGQYDSQRKIGAGLDYVIRNKIMIGTSVHLDAVSSQPVLTGKIGIKIN
jgi:hypothetical protein